MMLPINATPIQRRERSESWVRVSTGTNPAFAGSKPIDATRNIKVAAQDWITEEARKLSAKELAQRAGMSVRAAEDLRAGKSRIQFNHVFDWSAQDPLFRAALIARLSGQHGGEDFGAVMAKAINDWMRSQR